MANEKQTTKTGSRGSQQAARVAEVKEVKEEKANIQQVIQVIVLAVVLGASSYASQAVQYPLFGATLAASWFRVGIFVYVAICSLVLPDSEVSRTNAVRAIGALLALGSFVVRPLGAWAAANVGDATMAPLVVHAVIGFPVVGLGGTVWLQWMNHIVDQEDVTTFGRYATIGFSWFALTNFVHFLDRLLAETLPLLGRIVPSQLLIGLGLIAYSIPLLQPPRPSQSLALSHTVSRAITILPVALGVLSIAAPTLLSPYPYTDLRVVYQNYSTSGFIQVADNFISDPPFRYLRCDASILGGAFWVPGQQTKGSAAAEGVNLVLGDSIHASFVLQDAVRLVDGVKGKRALVIGVGTGVAANALIAHGYNTTLIELDDAIYTTARAYFGLSAPSEVYIEDASRWVRNRAESLATQKPQDISGKFDVVVHDVFTGGELPSTLFTVEFWESLRAVMRDEGVVGVNFVGNPQSPTFKSLLHMLLSVFSVCRAFHDGLLDSDPLSFDHPVDFAIFCTPSPTLLFRPSKRSDYLNSALRETVLSTLSKREIDVKKVLGETDREIYLLRDDDGRIKSWGKESLVDYWKAVRKDLPAEAWSTF